MQILITHSSLLPTRVLHFSRIQLGLLLASLVVVLVLFSGVIYHFIFLKAAREGWPVVSQIVRLVVRDEFAQRDRYLRENLDAMADKVGAMQAKLIKLEAMGERVSSLAGMPPQEFRDLLKTVNDNSGNASGGKGGPYVPLRSPSLEQLGGLVGELDGQTDQRTEVFTLIESRLFEKRLSALMVPNSRPVDGPIGSGFGFRPDPFFGRPALHTGLDFPAEVGTPIQASAGGVVTNVEHHPQYGLMVEVDHGRGLVTRYAHTSKVLTKVGDIVKRGQLIAQVGTTGRSTGPHLHFEVLVEGVQQNPAKFLATGDAPALPSAALAANAGGPLVPAAAQRR
jgi:murein DD-endopeptidase MepM/ murein hydrolase activator NlpD